MKQKQLKIMMMCSVILMLSYLFVNFSFILASIRVKPILSKIGYDVVNPEEKMLAGNYIRNISEIRVRGCTAGAKLILLSCNICVQDWVLGKEKSVELNQYLGISKPKQKNVKNEFQNNNIPSEEELIKFNNEFDIGG